MSVNPPRSAAGQEPTTQNADRSEELLEAACRIIAKSGARKLSMRDVANEAGVSKALLHYYFDSRDDLLARAYEFADNRGRNRVLRDVDTVESGAVRLSRLFDLYLSDDEKVREDWVLWSELSSTAMFEPELRPVMEAAFARWCTWIESLVADAIAEGSLPSDTSKRDAALRFTALNDGLGSLVARRLIERSTARSVLRGFLQDEFERQSPGEGMERPGPVATGYLRLLARLTRTAVEELDGLATNQEEAAAISTVSALIEARTVSGSSAAYRGGAFADLSYPRGDGRRGRTLAELQSPIVVVDADRLDHNLRDFAIEIADRSVAFRPHLTSHRCLPIALRQMQLGAVGFTVSTAHEAEILWSAGFHDIVIASPMAGVGNWHRIAQLASGGHRIVAHVDSEPAGRGLSEAARTASTTIGVQIEIDVGYGLSGIRATDVEAVARLVEIVSTLDGLEYQGIAAARGTASHGRVAGDDLGRTMAALADGLRARSLPPGVVAAGSTQSAHELAKCAGVTEVRAGAYPFLDGDHVAGTGDADRIALTIESTVMSVMEDGLVTIDAGATTLGAASPAVGGAFAASTDGRVSIERLDADRGIGRLAEGATVEVAERLRLIPASAAAVIGAADVLIAVRGDEVLEVWPTISRKSPFSSGMAGRWSHCDT